MKIREVIKNGYFTVRLTISVDPPSPTLQSAFPDPFCVFDLIL